MESRPVPTLHQLQLSFQTKIYLVADCLLLPKNKDDPDCQKLRRMLSKLETALTILSTEIKAQRQALVKLKNMTAEVDLFTQGVNHALNNIPEHIPSCTLPSTTVPPTPNEQALSTAAVDQVPDSVAKKLCYSNTKKPTIEIAYLTVEEFSSVPKYLKGRISYEAIGNIVGEFNKALAHKQKILTTPRSKQNMNIKNQIVAYKEQETKGTGGFFFIVDRDLTENTRIKLDSTGRNCLTILRHCGRIKLVQDGRLNRYCVCPN